MQHRIEKSIEFVVGENIFVTGNVVDISRIRQFGPQDVEDLATDQHKACADCGDLDKTVSEHNTFLRFAAMVQVK